MLNRIISKGKINKKEQLTLTDKDFIIKYDNLMMSRELEESDLDARELNVELTHAMLLKIIEVAIKNSIASELVSVAFNQSLDGSPTPMPFNQRFLYGTTYVDAVLGSDSNILGPRPLILIKRVPFPFPRELYENESLLHWLMGMNRGEFEANIIVSGKMKNNTNKKEGLTLTDEDFTIKYGTLILSKELMDADLNADSIDITLTPSMTSKIVALEIKKVVRAEVGLFVDGVVPHPLDPNGPYALPERGTLLHAVTVFNDNRFQVNVSNLKK